MCTPVCTPRGWARRAWTWHEAADDRLFTPRPHVAKAADVVWIGNWGDDERTAELEDLYNNAPCGYHSVDAEGLIVRMNDTWLAWLGYSREELLGKTMQECYPGIDQTPMFALLERCMRERQADSMENEFAFDDGSNRSRTFVSNVIRPIGSCWVNLPVLGS